MRPIISLIIVLFAVSVVAAQEHSGWSVFRSEADGFSVDLPGTPKATSRDLAEGQTQRFFTIEIGAETFLVSVVQLNAGRVPANPDEAYFNTLMKAYTDGSKTTLRSSRMFTWGGHTAMEGISDADGATHVIDITTSGDRIYLVVYAGAKGQEAAARSIRMRDSFRLLAK